MGTTDALYSPGLFRPLRYPRATSRIVIKSLLVHFIRLRLYQQTAICPCYYNIYSLKNVDFKNVEIKNGLFIKKLFFSTDLELKLMLLNRKE